MAVASAFVLVVEVVASVEPAFVLVAPVVLAVQ